MEIRKMVTIVEDVFVDGEKKAEKPIRKVAVIAVIKNPFAGSFKDVLDELIDNGEELGKIVNRSDRPRKLCLKGCRSILPSFPQRAVPHLRLCYRVRLHCL